MRNILARRVAAALVGGLADSGQRRQEPGSPGHAADGRRDGGATRMAGQTLGKRGRTRARAWAPSFKAAAAATEAAPRAQEGQVRQPGAE